MRISPGNRGEMEMSNLKDNENAASTGAGLRIVAVDDEPLALELLVRTVHDVRPQAQIMAFTEAEGLLKYTRENPVDVAFLDIQMRGINGVELADALGVRYCVVKAEIRLFRVVPNMIKSYNK